MLARKIGFNYEIDGEIYDFEGKLFGSIAVFKINGIELSFNPYFGGTFYDKNGFGHSMLVAKKSGRTAVFIDGREAVEVSSMTIGDWITIFVPLIFFAYFGAFSLLCVTANLFISQLYHNKRNRKIMYCVSFLVMILLGILQLF